MDVHTHNTLLQIVQKNHVSRYKILCITPPASSDQDQLAQNIIIPCILIKIAQKVMFLSIKLMKIYKIIAPC